MTAQGGSLTVKAGHIERLPLNETVALVQFTDQQLAAAKEVDQMVLIQWNPCGDIAEVEKHNEEKRQTLQYVQTTILASRFQHDDQPSIGRHNL